MTNPTCTICGRPTDGYACHACAQGWERKLHTIAELTPDARAVAARQTRRGAAVRGSGGARPLPIDLAAGARLDAAQNALTTWVRHVAEERGADVPSVHVGGRTGAGEGDALVVSAQWLTGHVEWMRHRAEVAEFARDVTAVARVVAGIVDRPAERRWLGQCGADLDDDTRCETDLHARPDAEYATCKACGTRHDVHERRAWLDGLTHAEAYTARQIAQAYPQIPEATIRTWARRELLTAELVPLDDGVEGPLWVHRDEQGRARPRYVLGAVLALAAAKAAQRAEREARRFAATYPDTTDRKAAS